MSVDRGAWGSHPGLGTFCWSVSKFVVEAALIVKTEILLTDLCLDWRNKLTSGLHVQPVGYVSGLQGTCMALVAYPAAWVADRTRRDLVLKFCGLLSLGTEYPHHLSSHYPQYPHHLPSVPSALTPQHPQHQNFPSRAVVLPTVILPECSFVCKCIGIHQYLFRHGSIPSGELLGTCVCVRAESPPAVCDAVPG